MAAEVALPVFLSHQRRYYRSIAQQHQPMKARQFVYSLEDAMVLLMDRCSGSNTARQRAPGQGTSDTRNRLYRHSSARQGKASQPSSVEETCEYHFRWQGS